MKGLKQVCVSVLGQGRDLDYLALEDYAVGDNVVVQYSDFMAAGVVRRVYEDGVKTAATKFVVQKVDTSKVDTFITKVERQKELKKILDKKVEEAMSKRRYEEVLKGDADAEALIAELAQLEG